MKSISFAILLLANSAFGKPTSNSFKKLASESLDDATNLFNAKAAVLTYTGESLNEAAAYVGTSAVDYVSEIDPLEVTDNLEQTVLESKQATIKAVFDAKRSLIKGIQDATEQHGAQISAIVDASIQGVNDAIDTTAEGIVVTKNAVADFSQQITLENTQQALSDAFNASAIMIQSTVDSLVQSLVAAKQQLHDTAESFNSEATLTETKASLGAVLDTSTSSVGKVAGQYGVYKSIDNVVKTVAQLPLQINKLFARVEEEVGEKFEITKEILVEEAIQDNEDKTADEPVVDVKITVNGDVELDNTNLKDDIVKTVEKRFKDESVEDNEALV